MTDLLRLKGLAATGSYEEEGFLIVQASSPKPTVPYGCCIFFGKDKNGSKIVRFRDHAIQGQPVWLEIKRQRYRCQQCKATSYEDLPDIDTERRLTKRFRLHLAKQAVEHSFSAAAKINGVHETLIRRVFEEYADRRLANYTPLMPRVLGMDEIYLHGQARFVIGDVANKAMLDMRTSRRDLDLRRYFENKVGRENVPVVLPHVLADNLNVLSPRQPAEVALQIHLAPGDLHVEHRMVFDVAQNEPWLLLDVLLIHSKDARHLRNVADQNALGVSLEDTLDLFRINAVDLRSVMEGPLNRILLDAHAEPLRHVVGFVDVRQGLVEGPAALLALVSLPVDLDEDSLPPNGLVSEPQSLLGAVANVVDQQAAELVRRGLPAPDLDDQVAFVLVVADVLKVLEAQQVRHASPSAAPLEGFRFSAFTRAASTTSRMNSARRNLPATASIRSRTPALKRTSVLSSSLSFGTATFVTDIGLRVKTASNAISLLDPYPMSD